MTSDKYLLSIDDIYTRATIAMLQMTIDVLTTRLAQALPTVNLDNTVAALPSSPEDRIIEELLRMPREVLSPMGHGRRFNARYRLASTVERAEMVAQLPKYHGTSPTWNVTVARLECQTPHRPTSELPNTTEHLKCSSVRSRNE